MKAFEVGTLQGWSNVEVSAGLVKLVAHQHVLLQDKTFNQLRSGVVNRYCDVSGI